MNVFAVHTETDDFYDHGYITELFHQRGDAFAHCEAVCREEMANLEDAYNDDLSVHGDSVIGIVEVRCDVSANGDPQGYDVIFTARIIEMPVRGNI